MAKALGLPSSRACVSKPRFKAPPVSVTGALQQSGTGALTLVTVACATSSEPTPAGTWQPMVACATILPKKQISRRFSRHMADTPANDSDWIDESKALEIAGVPRSTFQGWAKAGLVERDAGGAYTEDAVLEFTLLAALRDHLSVQQLGTLWPKLRALGTVADLVGKARALDEGRRLDLVVELAHGGISAARNDEELVAAVRHPGAPRALVVMDVAPRVALARDAFRTWATDARRPTARKPGRPRGHLAPVTDLRAS